MAWEELGTSRWAPRWCSPSDNLASSVPQSYCLKVKEMDDEEYSCIVSATGGGGVAVLLERLGVHNRPLPTSQSPRNGLGLPGVPGGPGQPRRGLGVWPGSCFWRFGVIPPPLAPPGLGALASLLWDTPSACSQTSGPPDFVGLLQGKTDFPHS